MLDGKEPDFPAEAVKAMCQRHQILQASDAEPAIIEPPISVECLAIDTAAIPAEFCQTDLLPGSCALPQMSQQDWALEQRNDRHQYSDIHP